MSTENKIDVLDHGYVRLIDSMGSDLSISRAARVSYDAAWRAGEDEGSDARLIHYLWRNRHTTPFEAVTFTFEISAPIFVVRQWHRHRIGWTYNELSGRYRELPEEFYVPRPEHIGEQSRDNKQGRDLYEPGEFHIPAVDYHVSLMRVANETSFVTYHELLAAGVPRELARTVLPLATYTHMQATTNLHALFHFLKLRGKGTHSQYEIRAYADALLELVRPIVPVAVAAWEEGK